MKEEQKESKKKGHLGRIRRNARPREPAVRTSVEEEEELSKVPSALSIAQRPMCKCDNCSDKALGYWQFAGVLVDDGEEVRTRNLCQQCCNEERKEQVLGMESFGGTDSATPQPLEKRGKNANFARHVGLFIG